MSKMPMEKYEIIKFDIDNMRARPGMYIGGYNERGMTQLIEEVIDECINLSKDEIESCKVRRLSEGFFEIEIIGAIPRIKPRQFVEQAKPRSGIEWDIGLLIVCVMSDHLQAEVIHNGKRWKQRFSAGVAIKSPIESRSKAPNLFRVKFRPDPSLFKNLIVNPYVLLGRLQERALFHPATLFQFEDRLSAGNSRQFHYPQGLVDYARELEYDLIGFQKPSIPHRLDLSDGPNSAEIVLFHTSFAKYQMRSYVNRRRTPDDGTHVDAFEAAFKKIAGRYRRRDSYPFEPGEEPLHGLTVLLAVRLVQPNYGRYSSTRADLNDAVGADLVARLMDEQLPPLLDKLCNATK